MDKFQNKYRIPSARLQNWDYGWNAPYFVTICTANREHYFGEIVNYEMGFSKIGENANTCWLEIPNHFSFVKLDVHVVMPNHVDGIIVIDKQDDGRNNGRNVGVNVETQNFASLQPPTNKPPTNKPPQQTKNKFGPQSQNLASIIRGYKIGVTKFARNNNIDFAWQPRFHDHIIRDDKSYEKIRNYIINNPKNWKNDKFNND
jgi:putative transposase